METRITSSDQSFLIKTMTTPTTNQAPLAPPVAESEVKALTAWEGLAHRIAAAEAEAPSKVFDYNDPWDMKQARSWVAQLRRIKGSIERARKDAKAVHLERGRAVDTMAKTLEASVAGLIAPHDDAIKAIEAIEAERIAGHRSVLEWIEKLSQGVATSADAMARLEALQKIDTSTLEEFATAGANRAAEQSERLQELHETLLQQERDAAELEALRQEKARREAEERAEALRLEGERRAAARLAEQEEARRRAEAEELARAQRLAEAEEAMRHGVPATRGYRIISPPPGETAVMVRADGGDERARMSAVLVDCLRGKRAAEVAAELLDGTFHPAVTIDLSRL
jgi:colicin import membrane protein